MAEVLKAHPDGLTFPEIREKLELQPGEQGQLDRRKRDLYDFYDIETVRTGNRYVYVYRGELAEARPRTISGKDRAAVLMQAYGRCALCGRHRDEHGIALVVDHKIPKDWGGSDDSSNLQALCEECNAGKKNYFASFAADEMRRVIAFDSPHVRIGELLKLHLNEPVAAWLIEFVARDQTDWPKRTRDLRYLGWDIEVRKKKNAATGRVEASYVLKSFTDWPENPSKWIREFEADRAKRNRPQ
jgi:5-methylcytosine-specific restriction endonuclease McrA